MKHDWSSEPERMMKTKLMHDSIKLIITKNMKAKRKQSPNVRNRIVFYAFLSENDALKKWKAGIAHRMHGEYTISKFLKEAGKMSYISGAFGWDGTPEGIDYWSNLNELWQEYRVKDAEKTK